MKKFTGLILMGALLTGCSYGFSDEELLEQHFPKDVVEDLSDIVTNVEFDDRELLHVEIDEEFIKTKISFDENGFDVMSEYLAERLPPYHKEDAICTQFTYYNTEREQDINIRQFCYKNE